MSTPPPPSQPPSGGFGAPQDPPKGGFAPPPPVPPAPPQQPPTQPVTQPAQPPAGQPPAGQAAYGYPQPGPGYGYPQQPGPATTPMYAPQPPAGGPAGGNDKRTQLMIVGSALLAIVLIVGGGLWYTSGDGGTGGGTQNTATGDPSASTGNDKPQEAGPAVEKAPGNPKSKPLFHLPSPQPAEQVETEGSWITDTTYVKSDVSKVVGYNLVDGAKKWEIPLAGEICGATKHVSQNKSAILFKAGQPTAENKYLPCTEVGVIDLEAGKLVWSGNAKSTSGGDRPASLREVTISGNTVAAADISIGGAAWNLADGKSLWLPKVDAEQCRDTGYAGGEALAVIRKCGQSPNYTLYAQILDPTTGAPKASYKLSPGIDYAGIVSTKPLVVAADVGDTAKNATGVSDLFVVDDKGELKARISVASGNFDGKCAATEVEKCTAMVVGNGKLYLPSTEHQGQESSIGRTNELLSFDLTTGKQTSDRADAGEGYQLTPLRMDGPNIIAYKEPPYDKGAQVVSIDGKTMKETLLMENPAEKTGQRIESPFSPDYSEYRYHNGKLFISRTSVRKPYSDKSDPEHLFVSFTAS
ncbi:PQQ-like beta-propeller repeat protein [Streptomyces sp. NBC_01351]|uniref:outer membrane protein assembly factor BamB family protein n=1 Tax=Streptomyces sp. NBC_01351 TaxID=2903833 RepID=UPI002E30ABF3|nr:PQQ-binding-like beta-propeller repeat protein [Streptomyces sp. NBC_01351]